MKYKKLNRKKALKTITENLSGSASLIALSTLSINNPSVGITISSSKALLSSFAVLISEEYISKLKTKHTNYRDWINIIILSYEKTLKQSMIDKKNDEKKALDLKKVRIKKLKMFIIVILIKQKKP